MGFPGDSDGKDCLEHGRPRFDHWVRRFPREGNGNTLQYSCLENSMDRDMKLYLKNEMQTKIFSLIRFKIIVLNPEFNSYNS